MNGRIDTPTVVAAAATVPSFANLGFALAVIVASLTLLFGVPWLLNGGQHWAPWLVPVLVLAVVPHWGLIHEAIHGHLLADPRGNDRLGRVLAILFLSPFDTLRFGHLSHHALNARPAERPEYYDPRLRSRLRATVVYYARLLFGLYLLEVVGGLLSLLPRRLVRPLLRGVFYDHEPEARQMADRAERQLLARATLRQIRLEAALVVVGLVASFLAYGAWWPCLVLVLAGRALLISLLDNAPHYDGPLAQPDQGYDMRLPPPVARLVLNTNYHGTHHRHPNLPWTALPEAFATDRGVFTGSYLVMPWRQLRGPTPLAPHTPAPS